MTDIIVRRANETFGITISFSDGDGLSNVVELCKWKRAFSDAVDLFCNISKGYVNRGNKEAYITLEMDKFKKICTHNTENEEHVMFQQLLKELFENNGFTLGDFGYPLNDKGDIINDSEFIINITGCKKV